jgi:SAM-dependent methyltransferase
MKQMWNKRAKQDAFYYVESAFWNGDIDNFFALGEERAQLLIDPILGSLTSPAEDSNALEIGCGLGRFSRALSKRFKHVVGVDVSDEMVRQAKELNSEFLSKLEFQPTDGTEYPLVTSSSIDFVFSYEVFQHMPSSDIILNNLLEVRRVLKPTGTAFIHLMTKQGSFVKDIKKMVKRAIPESLWHRLGFTPLKFDDTWTGTSLSYDQIRKLTQQANLELKETIEDPTHGTGDRTFIVLKPLVV